MVSTRASSSGLSILEDWLTGLLAGFTDRPLLLGLCGAQGSGKSTLARSLADRLESGGRRVAVLLLDDLYLTKAERSRLAREVHPLLITRGVPGTHDVALGLAILDAVAQGRPIQLPRFDKSSDDRAPESEWGMAPAELHLFIFEGWCVGARAEPEDALHRPVNRLEREEDFDGRWRTYVNRTLAGAYRTLFDRLDRVVLLAGPSFDVVRYWRGEQEAELRCASPNSRDVMDDATLARFVEHYERLTRYILAEMPARADLVLRLSVQREVTAVSGHQQ